MSCLSQIFSDISLGILDLIYPAQCILCRTLGEDVLCSCCLQDMVVAVPTPYCLRCGQPQTGSECSKCVGYPKGLVRCRAVGVHEGTLATAIHLLKYRDCPMLAQPLGSLIADYLTVRAEIMNDLRFDAIVPVPLHKWRERQRGYNQSDRLARRVGAALDLPVDGKTLARVRNTGAQVGKVRAERLKNLTGAFRATPGRCAEKHLLLLDDVSTTGSTLGECANALLQAGASSVYAVTLAAG